MKFKNKNELIRFIEKQTGFKLNNENNILNKKRYVLYTEIDRLKQAPLLSFFKKIGVRYEHHINNHYWIFVK